MIFFFGMLSKVEVSAHIAEHLKRDKTQTEAIFRIFKQMPDFVNVLEGILAIQCEKTCREKNGCSIGGSTHQCSALECVNSKGVEGCWECDDYKTCDKLAFQKKSYGKTVIENLARLEREGKGSLRPRGNQYYEWQRKIIKANETP